MAVAPVTPFAGSASIVKTGGRAVFALYGPIEGGIVTNPQNAADQGLSTAETLYVDIVGIATLGEGPTTYPLQPGQSYFIPAGDAVNVSVNAASSGHRFSAIMWQPAMPFVPSRAKFPPPGPTNVLETIPSYLYQEYQDDDDLQAFVAGYNTQAQEYVDWFNQIGLPVYTGSLIVGALLDWVAAGLYGMTRPALPSGLNRNEGPLNTWALNTLPLNEQRVIGNQNFFATTDDTFKRVLTWHLFKGDGKVFNIRWLKRRIMRFLIGVNGTNPNIDNTYQVSVTFGLNGEVSIRILGGVRNVLAGPLNTWALNTLPLNTMRSTFITFAKLSEAPILQAAIAAGVLEMPFQFTYDVTIG